MGALNIFVDGTWLWYQCGAGQVLANTTESPDYRFPLDFQKLGEVLLHHVRTQDAMCDRLGDRYLATSVFKLPDDFKDWPNRYTDLTSEQIEQTERGVHSRESFLRGALDAGFRDDAIFRPPVRDWTIRKLAQKRYQEKQVDAAVVALLVRSAITKPGDYHVIITGDSDILPAVRIAYPQYTNNVIVASAHPDELKAGHRQTSFSLFDFDFKFKPFFLQDNADKIIEGLHVHRCAECAKVFTLNKPLPKLSRPYCSLHRKKTAGQVVPRIAATSPSAIN
jgi:uncharacterized LabA/DUF88 family protein